MKIIVRSPLGILVVLVLLAAGLVGYVMNIYAIFTALDGPVTALFLVRCIGIFVPPAGALLGYF
jgi:hypothetical protein